MAKKILDKDFIVKTVNELITNHATGSTLFDVLYRAMLTVQERYEKVLDSPDKVMPLFVDGFHPHNTMVIKVLKTYIVASPSNHYQVERNRLLKKAIHELLRKDDPDFQEERL